jgi:hypothetical protein
MALLFAVLAAGPMAATRVAADDDRAADFQATLHSTLADVFCSSGTPNPQTTGCAALTGGGYASHLGRATIMTTATANFSNPNTNCFPVTLLSTITARGGAIGLRAMGTLCFTSQNTIAVNTTFTVTGGTGRFAGATGQGTEMALVTLAFGNPTPTNPTGNTGVLTDSFHGTLSVPHTDEGDSGE